MASRPGDNGAGQREGGAGEGAHRAERGLAALPPLRFRGQRVRPA